MACSERASSENTGAEVLTSFLAPLGFLDFLASGSAAATSVVSVASVLASAVSSCLRFLSFLSFLSDFSSASLSSAARLACASQPWLKWSYTIDEQLDSPPSRPCDEPCAPPWSPRPWAPQPWAPRPWSRRQPWTVEVSHSTLFSSTHQRTSFSALRRALRSSLVSVTSSLISWTGSAAASLA